MIFKWNNKGFTMVELLVAMAIMGLLVIMAFPTIRSIQMNNQEKKDAGFVTKSDNNETEDRINSIIDKAIKEGKINKDAPLSL